ncbi:hypothetical protein [Syntrophus aciditrophicus]|uniref:Hypothetical cytosolic protein n=1 Tax=Syntrophus aciditrophicus (strain SB) TaxID=56780 RepID=Q2LPN6_SYNAS|nr:hypothetical protein [Syntrophus aciditrophicus]ABC76245.1 hypothetical cytosolic protein [Syntrophus aciditrophicus SB]OPY17374.1 MAG: hypothetical protein A4E74_01299 [Syntrophus sp. PtaB.Bin075]
MAMLQMNEAEAAETREMLKAVIKPLERQIAAVDLGRRDFRQFLKHRRALVDDWLKQLEKSTNLEMTDEDAKEGVAMLKDAIVPLERSIAATDLGHRDYREFLKKRRSLVDVLLKRLEK